MKNLFYFALAIFMLVSCDKEKTAENNKFDFDGIDLTIKPGDNFFNHVNKTWYDKAVIADESLSQSLACPIFETSQIYSQGRELFLKHSHPLDPSPQSAQTTPHQIS